MTTVYGFGASTLSTYFHRTRPTELTLPQRRSEGTASAAVISLPLWNLTPLRSAMVWRSPLSLTAWDSASRGTGLKDLSYVKSDSLTCHMISYTMTAVLMGMSSVGGSPIEATLRTPPMRGVSCAEADAVSAPTR